jgi:hypothetical protein
LPRGNGLLRALLPFIESGIPRASFDIPEHLPHARLLLLLDHRHTKAAGRFRSLGAPLGSRFVDAVPFPKA